MPKLLECEIQLIYVLVDRWLTITRVLLVRIQRRNRRNSPSEDNFLTQVLNSCILISRLLISLNVREQFEVVRFQRLESSRIEQFQLSISVLGDVDCNDWLSSRLDCCEVESTWFETRSEMLLLVSWFYFNSFEMSEGSSRMGEFNSILLYH